MEAYKDSIFYTRFDRWFKVNRYYAMNFDYFEMEPHSHHEFEIMHIANGKAKISWWDEAGERVEWNVREGEYVFIDGNVKHQLEVTKGGSCRILNLEISLFPKWNSFSLQLICNEVKSLQDFISIPMPVFRGTDDAGNLHRIITELHRQLQSSIDLSENDIVKNLVLEQFIIELARQSTRKYHVNSGSKYVRKANAYLANNYDHDFKIQDIADEIGISIAYLQRLYKEQSGKTLVDKMNELRVEKAKILLETSCLPIMDIAINVGYNNRQHFTYTFTSITGCSPTVYRKHRGNFRAWVQ